MSWIGHCSKAFGDAAINAGEMVLVPFDGGIESFAGWQDVDSAPSRVDAIAGDCDRPSRAPWCGLRSSSDAVVGHLFRHRSPEAPLTTPAGVHWWIGRVQSWSYAATNQRLPIGLPTSAK